MPSRETVSLYYRAGTSDKVYHVQLEPSGTGWLVNAQHGRRGGTLTELTKTPTPVSFGVAKSTYDDLVSQKKKKGYTPGALAGKSAAVSTAPPATPMLLPALPSWDDFEMFYVEVATALGEPSTLRTTPRGHLVLLADIASGLQEGALDAIAQIKRVKAAVDARKLLSRDGESWLNKLASGDQATLLDQMHQACRKAAV